MFLELAGAGFSALAELSAGFWVLALAGAGFAARDESIVPSNQLRADAGSGSSVWSALAELGAGGDASVAHVMSMPFESLLEQENFRYCTPLAAAALPFFHFPLQHKVLLYCRTR